MPYMPYISSRKKKKKRRSLSEILRWKKAKEKEQTDDVLPREK